MIMTKQREKELGKKTKVELIEIIRGYETKSEDSNIPLNLTISMMDSNKIYSARIESDTTSTGMPMLRGGK